MPLSYQRLADYLAVQPGDTVTLLFADVEAILGTLLPPPDAYFRGWWRPGSGEVAATLAAVGWQVGPVNPSARQAVFQRRSADSPQ